MNPPAMTVWCGWLIGWTVVGGVGVPILGAHARIVRWTPHTWGWR